MRLKWIIITKLSKICMKNMWMEHIFKPPPPRSTHNYHDYLSCFILENFSNFLCHNLMYTKLIKCHGRTFIYCCCIEDMKATLILCGMQRVITLSLTLLGKQWKEVKITQFVNLSSGNWFNLNIRAFCSDILYVDSFNIFYSF